MIKYEFMRAHGKGSEGSEKGGGGAKRKRGCEKKGGAPHPLFSKRGVHAAQAPPLCTPLPTYVGNGNIAKICSKHEFVITGCS